ncbi:MAG: hypothetical protein LBV27_05030 [Oscillospiraceae bacterium]|jgi:Tfp pilus assembly protein PilE|nr:hypothetical protein [Oscillospiraceae bacterium]
MFYMQRHAKSGLFLIEMIIAIAFFAVSSAVCISLFVQAHLKSALTHETNMAVVVAQSAAECFKAANGSPEETARILACDMDEGKLYLYYDNAWNRVTFGGDYRVGITIDTTVSPVNALIEVYGTDDGETIHTLSVKKYVSR